MDVDILKANLVSIDPYEFEQLVADLWEEQGFQTKIKSKSKDEGIDIIAEMSDPVTVRQLIQAKRYSKDNKIGSGQIRKYSTLYQQENADKVILVTTTTLTSEAKKLADKLEVEIVNIDDILEMLGEYPEVSSKYFKNKISEQIDAAAEVIDEQDSIVMQMSEYVSEWDDIFTKMAHPSDRREGLKMYFEWRSNVHELISKISNLSEQIEHTNSDDFDRINIDNITIGEELVQGKMHVLEEIKSDLMKIIDIADRIIIDSIIKEDLPNLENVSVDNLEVYDEAKDVSDDSSAELKSRFNNIAETIEHYPRLS